MASQILDIENAVAAFLRQSYADFTQNGVNLLRLACNNARKFAERMHDWEFTRQEVQVTTSATGLGNLSSAVLASDGVTSVSVKQPESFYLNNNGTLVPLRHSNKKLGALKARELISKRTLDTSERYLADDTPLFTSGAVFPNPYHVYIQGTKFQLEPRPTEAKLVNIDVFEWMDEYTADADTDWFVQHGADYLMYAAIVEVNFFNNTFTGNQEGNQDPPTRMRDDALQTLIEQDNFFIENGRLPG